MSGICGIVRFDGGTVAERDVQRQIRALGHLGPDRTQAWCDGPAGMGALLMRVTQEDFFDRQPLHDPASGLTLVADARIDNREDLAAALAIGEAALRDMPDSALLLAAWRKWGADCVERLIGDFAFAVWDDQAKSLTLVRDHMGLRCVHYHWGDGFFAFATEIKGLWALPEVPRRLLEDRFISWRFMDRIPDPDATHFEGVYGVPGGAVLKLDADGALSCRRYWEPHADPAHLDRDEDYYIETYRKILGEAVACRLRRAAAPAGVFMSGGFDSAAICALAGPIVAMQGRKLIAASSVMPEDYIGDILHARPWVEICRRHMPHLDVRYVTRDNLDIFTGMEKGFLAVDDAQSPNGYVVNALYEEIARSGAHIVMDGFGGDYTVNPRGQDALARWLVLGRFGRFWHEFRALSRHNRQGFALTLRRNVLARLVPNSWHRAWRRYRAGLRTFGPTRPFSRRVLANRDPKSLPRHGTRTSVNIRAMHEMTLRVLQNNSKMAGTISAAAHGLELTQPFHDKRVVEFGLAIPEDLYLKNGRARHLAREALKDLYPPEFQDRAPAPNEDMAPDSLLMAKRIEKRLLAEIARMENTGRLSLHFDFPRMRRMLTRRSAGRHRSGSEMDTRQAMHTFLLARYIEWFRGDNT
jgi:asparagine synthase (glutamine-hydrolysing)